MRGLVVVVCMVCNGEDTMNGFVIGATEQTLAGEEGGTMNDRVSGDPAVSDPRVSPLPVGTVVTLTVEDMRAIIRVEIELVKTIATLDMMVKDLPSLKRALLDLQRMTAR